MGSIAPPTAARPAAITVPLRAALAGGGWARATAPARREGVFVGRLSKISPCRLFDDPDEHLALAAQHGVVVHDGFFLVVHAARLDGLARYLLRLAALAGPRFRAARLCVLDRRKAEVVLGSERVRRLTLRACALAVEVRHCFLHALPPPLSPAARRPRAASWS